MYSCMGTYPFPDSIFKLQASCRRNFSLEVVLLDALGRSVHKEMEVKISSPATIFFCIPVIKVKYLTIIMVFGYFSRSLLHLFMLTMELLSKKIETVQKLHYLPAAMDLNFPQKISQLPFSVDVQISSLKYLR